MKVKIEKVKINYQGKLVTARKLIVSSKIPININDAWQIVQTSKLLEFISKGKIKFKPINGSFPKLWQQNETVSTKMLLFGFIPFGGIHSLYFENIDNQNKVLQTREKDNSAKVWDHTISLVQINEQNIIYQDLIIIYGGLLTKIITLWAKSFYKHRQKRWQIVAKDKDIIK
jgi:hypothetical protein